MQPHLHPFTLHIGVQGLEYVAGMVRYGKHPLAPFHL